MALVDELADARDLPLEAIRRAARTPDRVAAGILRALERAAAGETLGERDGNLLFWGIHVLAQARDTRVFGPLLALLGRPSDEVEKLLGDALASTLARVLASTYDGDAGGLVTAILRPETDEYGRWALLNAATMLAIDERIERPILHDALRRFDETRPSAAGEPGWIGWAEAVAILGFADLAPQVEAAFAAGRLLDDQVEKAWFDEALAAGAQGGVALDELDPDQFGTIDDAATELEAALAGDEDGEPPEPVVNPLRHVGRNDPCPCGSGRKYKACCLGKTVEPVVARPLPPLR